MTRQQIRITAQEGILGEVLGTPGYGAPFLFNTWITQAADELCEATDCLYGSATCGIVADQSTYCMPNSEPFVYKIKGVFWTDGSGNKQKLNEVTTAEMDGISASWRNDNSGSPTHVIIQGNNQFRLYPTPDTTLASGLLVEGYAKPAGSWSGNDAECPVPGGDSTHMTVAWGVCFFRADQFPQAFSQEQIKRFADRWAGGKGRLESETVRLSQATSGTGVRRTGIARRYY